METIKSAKLFHPICHLLNGERLYYIFISFRRDVNENITYLIEDIKKKFVFFEDSSCIYSIFGDLDLLIRLWSPSEDISNVEKYLNSRKEEIRFLNIILIDHSYTWYQHLIDKRNSDTNQITFSEDNITKILDNDYEDDNNFFYIKTDTASEFVKYKIWLLIEDRTSSRSNIFSEIIKKINSEDSQQKLSDSETDRISIYSFKISPGHGLLIKADTSNFLETSEVFYEFISDLSRHSQEEPERYIEYKIMTYIACERLAPEMDSMYKIPVALSHEVKKQKNIENICKLHDCYADLYKNYTTEYHYISDFSKQIDLFYQIFDYQDILTWTSNIEKLRILYRCVVESKEERLKAFLIREYIKLESRLRDQIEKIIGDDKIPFREINGFNSTVNQVFHKVKDRNETIIKEDIVYILSLIEEKAFGKKDHITLGIIPNFISRLMKTHNFKQAFSGDELNEVKKFLEDLSISISACSDDRNLLMHGNSKINNLFDHKKGYRKWSSYIKNFIKLGFSIDYSLDRLKKIFERIDL